MDLAAGPYRDDAGYADLRGYGAIGDTRTVALVAPDGSIDWLPIPDIASMPVFGRLLDAGDGGYFELRPVEAYTVSRHYEERTNVLVTTFTTGSGSVRVTDALTMGVAGPPPWTELARQVEGLGGRVEMCWRVAPGTGLNSRSPWVQHTPHGAVLRLDSITLAVCSDNAGERTVDGQALRGGFTARDGSRHLLALVASRGEPLRLPELDRVARNIDHTRQQWRRWCGQFTYQGRWREEALRSMLTLKLLHHRPSGAIAAAATTSLPESPAGGKNWDYRFAWLRDSAYALHCMLAFGDFEDMHASVSWLLRTVRSRHGGVPVLAGLDGEHPDGITEHDVPGWRGIGPVVSGNPATGQLQLGAYGDLFDLVHTYVQAGNVLDLDTARFLAAAADRVCDIWHYRDSGMWELPELRHYTSSKMACWQALQHATDLVEAGHISGQGDRWSDERDRIRAWIDRHCWNDEIGAYTWYPATSELDTSVLLHARPAGFAAGERMNSTVDAILDRLSAGPHLYRYTGAEAEEKTFTACGFWAVAALASLDRRSEAEKRLTVLLQSANDVGLFAEMLDPDDDAFWANLPQALSHLAVTTAIAALA